MTIFFWSEEQLSETRGKALIKSTASSQAPTSKTHQAPSPRTATTSALSGFSDICKYWILSVSLTILGTTPKIEIFSLLFILVNDGVNVVKIQIFDANILCRNFYPIIGKANAFMLGATIIIWIIFENIMNK